MKIKEGVFAYLQSKTLLTALVSTRISPDVAKQEPTRPYIVYQITSSEHPGHLGGASVLARYIIMFSVYASDSDTRNAVREALRNVLNGKIGLTQTVTGGTIEFKSIALRGTAETNLDAGDGTEQGDFQEDMEFSFTVFETLPTLPA